MKIMSMMINALHEEVKLTSNYNGDADYCKDTIKLKRIPILKQMNNI